MSEDKALWVAAFGLFCLAVCLALLWRLAFPRRAADPDVETKANRQRYLTECDEIAGLGRVLGLLGDPFHVTEMIEARRRRGGTGRTTLMLLMAILSLRAGTDVVVVVLNEADALRLNALLVRWIQVLGGTARFWTGRPCAAGSIWRATMAPLHPSVQFACIPAHRLAVHAIGRNEYFDLYIDHSVWEFSALTIHVDLSPDHVTCQASEYALGCARRVG